jgi:excisionase family DNA binding protein
MDRALTLNEVAALLRVRPSTIYRLVKKGRIPGLKIEGEWRFNQDLIERWIRERETADSHEKITGHVPDEMQRKGR